MPKVERLRYILLKAVRWWLELIGVEITNHMIISPHDLFQIIEITQEGVVTSEAMPQDKIILYVVQKYGEQPLKYFNDYKRLKIVHLKTGTVKDLKLAIDF
jgi:hypothetical protein